MERKRKGFTLVELLVVISIIALLMAILMPALARVKALAYQMMCGTNLSAIGKAMLVYSSDYEEEYPCAGDRRVGWSDEGTIENPWDDTRDGAYGPSDVTITSSFYLLIKYSDVGPRLFVCKGDGAKEFKISDFDVDLDITEAWDFGDGSVPNPPPGAYCSYSYQMPYYQGTGVPGYPVTSVSNPGSPLCADRNPYLDDNAKGYIDGAQTGEEAPYWATTENEYKDPDKTGNAAAHQRGGQNVLFADIHVKFEKYPNVGIDNDNIWKFWTEDSPDDEGKQIGSDAGEPTDNGDGAPQSEKDAYLVGDKNWE